MQVTGNDLLWMQHLAKNVVQRKSNVSPLLEQAINAMGQYANAKETDAVSNEMKSKLLQLEKEAKVDPTDKLIRSVQEELLVAEQSFYGALGREASNLNSMINQKDMYTGIVDGTIAPGTVEFERAYRSISFSPEDKARFDFPDFKTYLSDHGYQGDGTTVNYLEDMVAMQDSNGVFRAVIKGKEMVEVQNPNEWGYSVASTVIFADQVDLYQQWQTEKQAHKVETLKAYAQEQIPQLQSRIEDSPNRIQHIIGAYALEKAAIMSKLPEGYDLEEKYLKNADVINELAEEVQSTDSADGKKVLDLLKQIIEKQREKILGLGGKANGVFYGLGGTANYGIFGDPNKAVFKTLDTSI